MSSGFSTPQPSVVMILPSSGRSITTLGNFRSVTSPPGGQVGLYVPLQQLAAVGKRHVHPHGIFHRRVVQRQLPREHQSFGSRRHRGLAPRGKRHVRVSTRVFSWKPLYIRIHGVSFLPAPTTCFPLSTSFSMSKLLLRENGLDRTVRQGVVFAGTACGRFILCEYLRV